MKRAENWPEALNDYIDSIRKSPFAWGTLDCCMMAADAVQDMTGEDFASDFRGKYDDPVSAYKALADFAGGGVDKAINKIAANLKWQECAPKKAHRGDPVLIAPAHCGGDPRFGGALGICIGRYVLVMTENGLGAIERLPAVVQAWNVSFR